MEVPGITLSCRELVELVTDYVEGALGPEERARFEQHLGVCEGCRLYVAQMRATIRATGTLSEQDVNPTARDALLTAFRGWKRKA